MKKKRKEKKEQMRKQKQFEAEIAVSVLKIKENTLKRCGRWYFRLGILSVRISHIKFFIHSIESEGLRH